MESSYFGRDVVGNSGLFSLSGALTLCAKWPSGTNIDDLDEETIDYILNIHLLRTS